MAIRSATASWMLVLSTVTACWCAPGDLDPAFGTGGIIATKVGGPYAMETGRDVLVQPDGRIVAVGGVVDSPDFPMLLVRYESDGTLDPSFGTGGVATWSGPISEARAAALQPDGKIVAAGMVGVGTFGLVRFGAVGSVDPSFGSAGVVTTLVSSTGALLYAMTLQPDGKILVAGTTEDQTGYRFVVVRYDASGALDHTFGSDGVVTTAFEASSFTHDEALAMALGPDGTIVLGGDTYQNGDTHFALARYMSDGTLDPTFGVGGRVVTDLGGSAYGGSIRGLDRQADGKVVAVGLANPNGGYDIALVRYLVDGSVDASFGNGGYVTTDLFGSLQWPSDIAVQPDGKLVVVGQTNINGHSGSPFFAVRYTPDGELDATFGTGGVVTTPVQTALTGPDYANAVALQPDSKIVVVGYRVDNYMFTENALVLVRYLGDCGDGVIEASETCDDGPENGVDGSCCDTACGPRPATVVCRAATGVCDAPELCTGTSGACPVDVKEPAGTVCRPATDVCDQAERCDGSAATCPPDAFAPSTVECRASAGPCDPAEHCLGTSSSCPADARAGSTTICRDAAGPCDVVERCDGSGAACPPDTFAPSTIECRAAAGVCDVPELCTGTAAACPADSLADSGTVCRPATSTCDVAERCTGTDVACPFDTGLPDTDGDGVCDAEDDCPMDPDPLQGDADGDGLGDACDPCTNGAIASRAKLTISRLAPPGGDDGLMLSGEAVVPLDPPLDPRARGVRVVLTGATGATLLDTTIPPGVYVARSGWLANAAGTAWTYRTAATAGVRKVVVRRASTTGAVRVSAKMKGGTYTVTPADLPVTATVVLDVPTAAGGQCLTLAFPATPPARPGCTLGGGRTLRCR
jgi:uncharacterized delta-60 repeat protein